MNFKSYQEEDIPNKDAAAAAATKKSSLTVGNEGVELKSKSRSKLKLNRWQTTPGIVVAFVVAIMLFVVVVLSPSSLHGIRGTGSGGDGGGGGDASIYYSKNDASKSKREGMCPTTGSPSEYSNGGSTQTPGVVYYGLDFSISAYTKARFPPLLCFGIPSYVSEWKKVWQFCAGRCNHSPSCRTFTVHVKKAGNKKWYGDCFYHDHWLDNHGSNFEKKSLNKRYIVSGVCRPEDSWDGYK